MKNLWIIPGKIMKLTFLCFLTLAFTFAFVQARVPDTVKNIFGLYGGANFNLHSADFYKLRDIPNCCPEFENGYGVGFNAGGLYERNFPGKFRVGARLGVSTLDGTMTEKEPTTVILDTGPIAGAFEHEMVGEFLNIGLEPNVSYEIIPSFLFALGARVGINLTYNYDQIETIVEPAGQGTFADEFGNDTGERTRNDFSGEIPDANVFQAAVFGSLAYELPLNSKGSFHAVPELAFYYPLTELVADTKWKANVVRAGIALKYSPVPIEPKEQIFEREYKIDTIRIVSEKYSRDTIVAGRESVESKSEKTEEQILTTETLVRTDTLFAAKIYKLDCEIEAVGVDSSGREIPNPVFRIEEFVSNKLEPLLNYVFFEENSAEIPDRYQKLFEAEARNFSISNLINDSTMVIYRKILNIVGRRALERPAAKLTLTGCNSNVGSETGAEELSRKRAEAVRDYLIDVWSIEPERIEVKVRNLPEKPSTPIDDPDKIQENRRVEITSNDPKIIEPLFIEKIHRKPNPAIARFKPKVVSDAGIDSWRIEAFQGDDPTGAFVESEAGFPPENIDWKLEQFQEIIPQSPEPIEYSLFVKDKKGNNFSCAGETLPIEVVTVRQKRERNVGDVETERYSLILFDFDAAEIEGINKSTIKFIKSRIKPESEIDIRGFTDRTGDAEHNKNLSDRRANAAKTALSRPDSEAEGIGEETLLYENETPEGRFYCRTVIIETKTPVK